MKNTYDNHKSLEPFIAVRERLLIETKGAYDAVIEFIKESVGEEIPSSSSLPKDIRKALHLALALYSLVPNIERDDEVPKKLRDLGVSEKNTLSEMDMLAYYLEELEGDPNNDCQILNRILPAVFDGEEVQMIDNILQLRFTGSINHTPRPGVDYILP